MKQPRHEPVPRSGPATVDPRSQGKTPQETPRYDASGRWSERPDTDVCRESGAPEDDIRQRFARGAEWSFQPEKTQAAARNRKPRPS